jgi:transposase
VGEVVTVDDGMEIVFDRVAGLDIGKKELAACVRLPDGRGRFRSQTKTFSTMTGGLLELADWLATHRVQVVAMEATGAYWKPVFYLLEDTFETRLVNPRDVRQVKGRKTDVKDAQWLAQLVQHDLVRSCFVPPPAIRDIRELTRQRTHLVRDRARALNRLEKLLEETGLKITSVASHTLGVSTRQMLQAIVAGERDPATLADLAKGRLRRKIPQLREALRIARFSDNTAFMIGQVLAQLDMLDTQQAAYTERITQAMRPFRRQMDLLMTIPGISEQTAAGIIGSIGVTMAAFPTPGHLASWAGVCPGNNRSAGRDISSATTHGDPYLRGYLGTAAAQIARPHSAPCYLKSYYQRLKKRRGPLRAQVAVQHKILTAIWHMLTHNTPYQDLGPDYHDHRPRSLQRRADHARRILTDLKQQGYDITQLIPDTAA